MDQKLHFLGAVKLHCLSFQNHFFPKFFCHSVSPGFRNHLAFSFQIKLTPIFLVLVLGANLQFALKKFVKWHFPKKVLFFVEKVTLLVITQNWWYFLKKNMWLFCKNNKFCHRKKLVKRNVLVSTGCGRGLICKNIHRWKNYVLCIFSKVIIKLE